MINQFVYWTLLALSSVYVFLRGGAPERVGMAILVIGSIATTASASADFEVRFRSVEVGMLAVDVAFLIAFLILALRAERFWPLWVTGFHTVGLATHAAKLVSPNLMPWAYAAGQALWGYLMILIMVLAARGHQIRLARNGADKSWTTFSPRYGRKKRAPAPKS